MNSSNVAPEKIYTNSYKITDSLLNIAKCVQAMGLKCTPIIYLSINDIIRDNGENLEAMAMISGMMKNILEKNTGKVIDTLSK